MLTLLAIRYLPYYFQEDEDITTDWHIGTEL